MSKLMEIAAEAAKRVASWSKSKQEYARRATSDGANRHWTECPNCHNLTCRPSDGQCVACT